MDRVRALLQLDRTALPAPSKLYEQRRMAEAAFSAIERRYDPAVGPGARYRDFRELALAVYNLERALTE